MHSIWHQPQDESDDGKIWECVEAIRANADESDPVRSPDPIAFISVFAIVLDRLVPEDVVRKHKDEIYEVMGELAGVLVELDGSLWSQSRRECLGWTYSSINVLDLQHGYLGSKLRALGRTLSLPYYYKTDYEIDFELRPPLHSDRKSVV